jgi:ZIP family zinc transporter
MNPAVFLPFFSTILGGFAALRFRHRLHALMALAAGVVVATAVAELLPEAYELAGPERALEIGAAAVIGFIGFTFLEAFLHQSSFEHAGEHAHGEDAAEGEAQDVARLSDAGSGATPAARSGPGLIGLLPPTSLVIHSALDGLAIGLAFQAGDEIGLIVLLAVLAHDFADGMNVATLALEAARGERLAVAFVLLDAVAAPIGGALSVLVTIEDATLGLLLALFAGVFLAVGAGHLLPESQHRDPRRGPAMVALAGIGAAIVLGVRAVAH